MCFRSTPLTLHVTPCGLQFIEEYKKANSSLDKETLYAEIASLRILENVEVPGAPKKAEPVKVRPGMSAHLWFSAWGCSKVEQTYSNRGPHWHCS